MFKLTPDQLGRIRRARLVFALALLAELSVSKFDHFVGKYSSNPHWVSGLSWSEMLAIAPRFLFVALCISVLAYLWPTSPSK